MQTIFSIPKDFTIVTMSFITITINHNSIQKIYQKYFTPVKERQYH
jgi:hypothetical protein